MHCEKDNERIPPNDTVAGIDKVLLLAMLLCKESAKLLH